jgi:ribosomal protein S18 acetylase RimI-like enzyme
MVEGHVSARTWRFKSSHPHRSTGHMNIQTLTELRTEDARALIVGYESSERYVITRQESAERASFALERVSEPFSKRFPLSEAMIGWYRTLASEGLSFLALEEERPVGLAIAGYMGWNATCTLWELHVDPAHRRRGIARALLGRVEAAAAAAGARRVWIETQNTNVGAVDTYRACGYEIAGLDLWYYSNSAEEVALFMQKQL